MTGSPLADGTRRFNDKRTAKKQTEDRRNLQFRRAELLLKGIMIAFLEGELAEAWPTQVIISVQGVGYLVQIPLSSFDQLPPVGQRVRLLTHLVVREDAHLLFGFANSAERDLFRLLLQHVSGVGPKLALAVLSGMTVSQFKAAVVRGDVATLAKISGVGKETAETIVLELKGRGGIAAALEVAVTPREDQQVKGNDPLLRLISLGLKQVEAQKALHQVYDSTKTLNTDDLVRLALKKLA